MKKFTLALLMLFCITTFAQQGVNKEKLIRHKGGLVDSLDNGGLVKIGRVAIHYGNVGSHAVDLSTSFQSGEYGATGSVSTAMGINTTASGEYATAMGRNTKATGSHSTTMGYITEALGVYSTAMGYDTTASGDYSTAMGTQTTASGKYATAMGNYTTASGVTSTAMGVSTEASGSGSTAIGLSTTASGEHSTAMGIRTIASGVSSTAMGAQNTASANYSTAMGMNTTASGEYATAMGNYAKASGVYSTAMGNDTTASGEYATAMGNYTTASGVTSTAMGVSTEASGSGSTAMGLSTTASGVYSTAMGAQTAASGDYSTAMGKSTEASGEGSTAMGGETTASGGYATAMGNFAKASGVTSTAMGLRTTASGEYSTAMGSSTVASGDYSTAMGKSTEASGEGSTAMGGETTASGYNSTAMGYSTKAESFASTTIGHFNKGGGSLVDVIFTDPLFEIGNGADNANRTNALTVLRNGTILAPTFDKTLITDAKALVTKEYADANYIGTKDNGSIVKPGRVAIHYGNVGSNAVDLSTSFQSGEYGATGSGSTAMGLSTIASGENATAMGKSTEASGEGSTAMGGETTASGGYATAMGNDTKATGYVSTAMGYSTKAEAYASTVIGHFNTGGGSPDEFISTDSLFEIGNGADDANRTNALTVLRNGTILAPTFDKTLITDAKALVTKEYADAQDAATKTFVLDLVATFEARIKVLERRLAAVGQSTPAINPVAVGGQTIPQSTPASSQLKVGDLYAGGVVFYLSPVPNDINQDGITDRGMVCALSDYDKLSSWGCYGVDITKLPDVTGAASLTHEPGAEINEGIFCSHVILIQCPTAPAALAARSLGSGWFLPSKKELDLMYVNKATLEAVSGFDAFSNFYWSSSEYDLNMAWGQNFFLGKHFAKRKDYQINVRAVRFF